jgi:hypothetical protein
LSRISSLSAVKQVFDRMVVWDVQCSAERSLFGRDFVMFFRPANGDLLNTDCGLIELSNRSQ